MGYVTTDLEAILHPRLRTFDKIEPQACVTSVQVTRSVERKLFEAWGNRTRKSDRWLVFFFCFCFLLAFRCFGLWGFISKGHGCQRLL